MKKVSVASYSGVSFGLSQLNTIRRKRHHDYEGFKKRLKTI